MCFHASGECGVCTKDCGNNLDSCSIYNVANNDCHISAHNGGGHDCHKSLECCVVTHKDKIPMIVKDGSCAPFPSPWVPGV
jgi:hypothetical protein